MRSSILQLSFFALTSATVSSCSQPTPAGTFVLQAVDNKTLPVSMFTDGANGTSQIISGSLELDGRERAIYRWHYRYLNEGGSVDTLEAAQDTMRFAVKGDVLVLYRYVPAGVDSPDSVLDADSGTIVASRLRLRAIQALENDSAYHELLFVRE